MSFWSGLLSVLTGGVSNIFQHQNLGDILNNAGETANDIGTQNLLGNYMAKTTGSRLTDAEREANAFTAEREDIAWQREMDASNTAYQRQVTDMQRAGINPMMAVSSGGASQPSSSTSGSVVPGASNLGGILSSLASLMLSKAQVGNIKADTALKHAEVSRVKAETEGTTLSNAWINRINEANLASKNAATDLDKKRVAEVDAHINELASSASSLEAKAFYDKANAYKIQALLPYEKLFFEAQTESERAAAALSFVNAAYQQKLIDNGYVDQLFDKAYAETMDAEQKAVLHGIEVKIKTGHFHDLNKAGDYIDGSLVGAIQYLGGNFISAVSNIAGMVSPFK